MKKYIVTVDFADAGMHHDVAARELTLKFVSSTAKLWPVAAGDSVVADSAATAANEYRTTITVAYGSGCALGDSLEVRLDGVALGKTYINITSCDTYLSSPGAVDAGDLVAFGQQIGCPANCPTGQTYNPCFDWNPVGGDGYIDQGDIVFFGYHYGGSTHQRPGYSNKVLSVGGEVILSEEIAESGRAITSLALSPGSSFVAAGIILKADEGKLRYASWRPANLGPSVTTYSARLEDAEDGTVGIFVVGTVPMPGEEAINLGTIEWTTMSEWDIDEDIALAYGDVAYTVGDVVGLVRAGKPGRGPTLVAVDRLEPAEPNPFNPSTKIRFSIGEAKRIWLGVYTVGGRHVKTLANEYRRSGIHEVQWDGKDEAGRPVAAGIYVTRLDAGEFSGTQKLVLVR